MTLDVHAQDVGGVLANFFGVVGELNTTGFATSTDFDLSLHDDGVTNAISNGHGLVDRVGGVTW